MILDSSVLPMFFLSSFLVMIAPGPDMVFIIANSISGGKKSGFIASLGIASGAFIHFIAAALGISALILSFDFAYDLIRILGAGYLAWVGYQYLTTKRNNTSIKVVNRRSASKIFRQGVLTNLLNPKAILFNLSFFPQFVSVNYGAVWAQILILGGILIFIGIVINLLIVLMSSRLLSMINEKQQSFGSYFERAAGLVLIGLAVYVAVSRRPA